MPLTPIPEEDLGRGVDQFHPENRIPPGHVEAARNFDATTSGTLRLRSGYQIFAGYVPIRVQTITLSSNTLIITLSLPSAATAALRSSPILLIGRAASTVGPYGVGSVVATFYSSFTLLGDALVVTQAGVNATADFEGCVYGIRPTDLDFASAEATGKSGHVVHLDYFRNARYQHPVCALEGGFYAARTAANTIPVVGSGSTTAVAVSTTYKLPTSYANVNAVMSAQRVVAPLFWATGEAPARTRGYITSGAGGAHWLPGSTISYNSGTGYVEFLLSAPGLAVLTSAGAPESTISNLVTAGSDRVTIRGASHSKLNGSFVIGAISKPSASTILISASVPGIESTDAAGLPDATAGFSAGVFTDRLAVTGKGFVGAIVDDPAGTTNIGDDLWTVVAAPSGSIYVSGVERAITMPNARKVRQTLTTQTVPLMNESLTASADNWVRGDAAKITDLPSSRRIRVQNVYASADVTSLSVTGGGEEASFTNATIAARLSVGDVFRLAETSVDLAGEYTVSDISSNTVTFACSFSGTTTCTFVGNFIGLSESVEVSGDGTTAGSHTIAVNERWIAIEAIDRPGAPTSSAPNPVYPIYYGNSTTSWAELYFRSCMVGESMYIGNGTEPLFKYDGLSISAAGIPRWPPFAGVCLASDRSSGIRNLDRERGINEASAPTDGVYTLTTAGDAADFTRGDKVTYTVRASNVRQEYQHTVASTDNATTDAAGTSVNLRVFPTEAPAFSATGDAFKFTLSRRYMISTYRRDLNDRVTVTSPFHIQDAVVSFGSDHRPDLILNQVPLFSMFDWRRVETHVAISTGTSAAPTFVMGGIIPVSYTSLIPARIFQDGIQTEDAALRTGIKNTSLDVFNNIFASDAGPAYRPSLDRPPRAKAMANAASSLVLGNITSFPRATLTALPKAGNTPAPHDLAGTQISLNNGSDNHKFDFLVHDRATSTLSATVNSAVMSVTDMDGTSITLTGSAAFAAMPNAIADAAAGSWIQLYSLDYTYTSSRFDAFLLGWFRIRTISADQTITIAAPHKAKKQITAVDTGTDRLTVAAHGLLDGDPVQVRTPGGSPPAGITAGTQYYARVVSASVFTLHPTYADAIAGSGTVNITAGLTGTTYVLFVEQPAALSIAFAASRLSTNVPVVIMDVVNPGRSTYNDVDHRHRTVADKIASRDATLALTMRDLGRAINAVAAQQSFAPVNSSTTAPGIYCAAMGNDADQNTVEIESADETAFTLTVNGTPASISFYVNGSLATSTVANASQEIRYPSRVVWSYRNFPEVFDQPFVQDARFSDGAADVGEDNGDELTVVYPRYGESFSNAAAGQGVVLVGKHQSIHLLDILTGQVAQLETNGQGIPFPRSVCRTKNGIEFANESGLWKINDGNQCVFIGQILKRYWERTVNRDPSLAAETICGHHDARRNHAITSVPVSSDTTPTEAAVYDHTRESGDERGAWTTYSNLPAISWAVAGSDSLFGSTSGTVFSLRRANDETDYQDDTDPVGGYDISGAASDAYVLLAEKSFGAEGIRKRVQYVQIGFRSDDGVPDTSAIKVYAAIDHSKEFELLDTFTLVDPASGAEDNLTGRVRGNITTLRFDLPKSKCDLIQLKIGIEEASVPVEVVSVSYLVEALGPAGVPTAAGSRS